MFLLTFAVIRVAAIYFAMYAVHTGIMIINSQSILSVGEIFLKCMLFENFIEIHYFSNFKLILKTCFKWIIYNHLYVIINKNI